jgi:hypothetical protein
MTPKEKAKDLIEKHKMQCRECGGNETAKIHSLIAVDEILSLMIKFHNRHIEDNSNEIIFWEEVKREINNLK